MDIYLWPVDIIFWRPYGNRKLTFLEQKQHHVFAISACPIKGTLRRLRALDMAIWKWHIKHAAFVPKKVSIGLTDYPDTDTNRSGKILFKADGKNS